MYIILLFLLLSVSIAFSANILFVSPIPSPSHHIWNRALALGLVGKGHNVTLIGPDKDDAKIANYSHILLEGVYDDLHDNMDINGMADHSTIRITMEMQDFCVNMCEKYSTSKGLRALLNYPEDFKFDAILFDVTGGGCLYPLIQKFKYPPAIGVTAFLLPQYVAYEFGNHLYPAYIPFYGLGYTSEMTFGERVWNFLYSYLDAVVRDVRQYRVEDEIIKKIFGENVPSIRDFERNISLILANTDPILDRPQPLTPNFIPVGGLHTRKSQALPQDLQAVLDNAKNGVILFSLGTNVRSDRVNPEIQKALLDAFSKIKVTVIWKFESDIQNLPKNVIVRKWLPQNDVLGHPNVRLFIGHGGALSTQETMFHGVPMICIPFFMDQHISSKTIVNKKLGISLEFRKITSSYFLENLREVLDNPLYSKNMKEFSDKFKDRTETPLERGIFWIEYVIRHGGAHFLNTPARDLPLYVSSGLDVAAFLVLVSTIVVLGLCKVVRLIVGPGQSKTKLKTN